MSEILVIQNAKYEGLAAFQRLLEEDGFKLKTVQAKKEKIPNRNHSAVIILGAPESANDNLPYLKEELKLILESIKKQTPLLGICLGSQLIAKALGARVYQGKTKEIGFYHDVEFENQAKSKLFRGIKSPATVFHWHGDTFDLPVNAIGLARSKNYQVQAFQIGSAVGVQFHLEVDEKTIRVWLEKSIEELSKAPHIDPKQIIEEIPENIQTLQNNMKTFYQNFKAANNL